jgi:hypothetical protein
MTPTPTRKFGLLDAMILIVAFAVGLAVHLRLFRFRQGDWFDNKDLDEILNFLVRGITFASCWLAVLTVALTVIGLRRPRPALRCLARQPGAVACWSVMLTTVLVIAPLLVLPTVGSYLLPEGSMMVDVWDLLPDFFLFIIPVGAAVACSWTVGRLVGRWDDGGGWTERAGRGVGVGWLVVSFLGSLVLWANLLGLNLIGWVRTPQTIHTPIYGTVASVPIPIDPTVDPTESGPSLPESSPSADDRLHDR